MNKKMDRLEEMKAMTLDINKRIHGDDYFVGYRSQLQKSLSLIKKEHTDIASDDLSTLQKNYDALKDKLQSCHEDLINYASLLSNLQIKYDDDFDSPISRRNIKNINNAINKFDINILLRYNNKDKKME
tara:strand:- start:730 stop:1116 length:387 start_codon:yes stop_codon:yes gene_type:complete